MSAKHSGRAAEEDSGEKGLITEVLTEPTGWGKKENMDGAGAREPLGTTAGKKKWSWNWAFIFKEFSRRRKAKVGD